MRIKQSTIRDRHIRLANDEVNLLGPSLVLRDCVIDSSSSARNLSISETVMHRCTFNSKRKLINSQWCDVKLHGCKFTGKYSGCDFGWQETNNGDDEIKDCDFSETILDGCRFMNCSPCSIVFPKWPCFTVVLPIERTKDILSVNWPDDLGIFMEVIADSPLGTTASTGHARSLVRRLGGREEDFKELLKELGGVIM